MAAPGSAPGAKGAVLTSRNSLSASEGPESLPLPDGRALPLDLVELLGFPRADLCRLLVLAGIETSQHLLELSADERRVTPGVGPARWRRIEERLRDAWGVELGCLAPAATTPAATTPAPMTPPHRNRNDGGAAWMDETQQALMWAMEAKERRRHAAG